MNNMFLYFAGSLTHHQRNNQFNLATKWRDKISNFCNDNNIKFFNPALTFLIEKNHTYSSKTCVDQNRFYLNKTDILIVDLNFILESPGTQWELTYASEVLKIPIIAFGKAHWSPHIMYGITNLCEDIDEVMELLCNMFDQSFN